MLSSPSIASRATIALSCSYTRVLHEYLCPILCQLSLAEQPFGEPQMRANKTAFVFDIVLSAKP